MRAQTLDVRTPSLEKQLVKILSGKEEIFVLMFVSHSTVGSTPLKKLVTFR